MSGRWWKLSSAETPAAAVIVAGGTGRRLGGGLPKQYRELSGQPILLRAIRPFLDHPRIGSVVVVIPAGDVLAPPAWLLAVPVLIVAGGETRSDSVRIGTLATPPSAEIVLVHDGARPFVPRAVIDRVLEAARHGAVIAALPLADTLKEVEEDGFVRSTPDRTHLWQAQTPQGFPRPLLLGVHRRALADGIGATDDAALCERYGIPVRIVEGAPENLKVTHPADLLIAGALARGLLP
ncbi:MAG: 2-C-methyl-D-erythritol 4-phosphate cytidylyltransferase [Gemmatimonadota bacterium]|nr:2-C-methyl-D-erythritol 4-phosphate cytidylyltransferase [Gemmatimonadota bacterium]